MTRRRSYLLALFALALPLAACVPPSGPGTPTTTTVAPGEWPGATCLDGAGTDGSEAPDLAFSGTPNVRGNAVISIVFSGGTFVPSGNGTCSGTPFAATTIVRADDEASAAAICDSLGAGDGATSYTGSPWTLPADAWACDETYFL
jgi:hypothetical protein